MTVSADKAMERLCLGNKKYLDAGTNSGDVSKEIRLKTATEGQTPYAVIVTCSDSRVIPESIFSAGIGELFVIRSAGNVIGLSALGSIEYAVEHLGVKLVLIMGHTSCGAVGAALSGHGGGFTNHILKRIQNVVGTETDPLAACRLNVEAGIGTVKSMLGELMEKECGVMVKGAVYRIEDGSVEML